MGYLGFFTHGENVRCWANFVNQDGVSVVPINPVVSIFDGNTAIVSNAAMIQVGSSNLYYYDFTVTAGLSERTLEAIYSGQIDGLEVQGSDHFSVNKIKSHVLENRLANTRITFYEATSIDPIRKTAIGVLDRQVLEIKDDAATDWSSPVSVKTLYFWYENVGDTNMIKVGES